MVTVTRPVIVLPKHTHTLEEVLGLVAEKNPRSPQLDTALRIMRRTTVQERHFVLPVDQVFDADDPWTALRSTFESLCALAEEAASRALAQAGLSARDVDALLVTNVESRMPGVDAYLINALGLRANVRRIVTSQIGCAGGGWSIARGAEQIRAHPGSIVLVVACEAFSSVMHAQEAGIDARIFQALGGDGAAAFVMRDDTPAPGIRVSQVEEWFLHDSTPVYDLYHDGAGRHFTSPDPDEALRAVDKTVTALRDALMLGTPAGWRLQFTIVHPGGPAILKKAAEVLGLGRDDLRHAWDSLAALGNMGSVSIFDVMARVYDDSHSHGDQGGLVTLGPGFAGVAAALEWIDPQIR